MNNEEKNQLKNNNAEHFIDITSDVCPMTFVKTKLLLEKAAHGDVVEVRLQGTEPLENVPRSAAEHGHDVIDIKPEDPNGDADGIHRLFIRVVK